VTSLSRRTTVLSAAAIALVTAGVGASAAVAAPVGGVPSGPITGGKTTITLAAKTASALRSHGFKTAATGRATLKGVNLTLPVTGGHYKSGVGLVEHVGGLKISKGTHSVTIKNLDIRPADGTGTAIVTGHGRMSAVAVGSPNAGGGSAHSITYSAWSIALSKPLVKVLDHELSTTYFASHDNLGSGSTTLDFAK
jgi:hypothetical protein